MKTSFTTVNYFHVRRAECQDNISKQLSKRLSYLTAGPREAIVESIGAIGPWPLSRYCHNTLGQRLLARPLARGYHLGDAFGYRLAIDSAFPLGQGLACVESSNRSAEICPHSCSNSTPAVPKSSVQTLGVAGEEEGEEKVEYFIQNQQTRKTIPNEWGPTR